MSSVVFPTTASSHPVNKNDQRLSRCGVILFSDSLQALAFNECALEILAYPSRPQGPDATAFVRRYARAALVTDTAENGIPHFKRRFVSGRRSYSCGVFGLSELANAAPSTLVMLERSAWGREDTLYVSQQYDLTPREQQAVEFFSGFN